MIDLCADETGHVNVDHAIASLRRNKVGLKGAGAVPPAAPLAPLVPRAELQRSDGGGVPAERAVGRFRALLAGCPWLRSQSLRAGVLFTPIIKTGFQSFNLKIRKELDLFANLVPPRARGRSGQSINTRGRQKGLIPDTDARAGAGRRCGRLQVLCKSMAGYPTRHKDVDLVVIRENTEGEYSGLEHEVSDRVARRALRLPWLTGRGGVPPVCRLPLDCRWPRALSRA